MEVETYTPDLVSKGLAALRKPQVTTCLRNKRWLTALLALVSFLPALQAADVNNLDPSIIQSFTSGAALTPFSVPYSGATNTATLLAADLSTYVGSGIVPVTVTGSLLTSSLGGTYHNISDIGESSPFAFVDKTKVFPVWGLQEFSLVASLPVAYEVPEPGTYAAGVAVALLAGHQWLARRRRTK